ncbi:hypothetical protein [Yersinia intermedia]|uniref:Uncharacterized protein n=1 Tax=Yersinia intermedia TaxID=631 RepID=A0ABX6FE25_YERIN|nr:hypothetical protein [Yersinia intermedia]QGR67782.1 hypothetical protein FOC38_18685 [Yersinia intermedia]QGR72798.1 hypothetical protein FOC37_21985 [Yersinia intermedia]
MESPWPLKLAILLASLSFGAVLAAVTYCVYAPLAARLSALNLPAPITPISSDNYLICQLELRGSARRRHVLRVRSVGCAAFRTQSACADNANFLW